ncbi:hypothetical protein JZO66_08975 [Enterococcus sp. DIV0242_7C1]|uniref:Helix-turn-helix domain-containing protein n=1 Tax=Candidatus Enterococcus dunnyi TaxID=1834192 RepID=A0A200J949_9ENTE|nr:MULTISPECIES: helix-turn-helix domain-containing protein [unclassified Enterococcus]MBO0470678.1 hypothetical protein [Enterococcus sp. DIV0242_7C1]OUZ33127.1 hypothetical protein A5889_001836 [Enterococcus sp. 9D6_DIV0238]
MIDLNQVLTFTEAAEKWGLAGGNTIRQAVLRKKFEAHEIKKSGTVWLTTYEAMYRVFGESKKKEAVFLQQNTIFQAITQKKQGNPTALANIQKEMTAAFSAGRKVFIQEKLLGKWRTVYIFSTEEEVQNWLVLIQKAN